MLINFSIMGAVSWLIRPLLRVRADLFLYLHRPEDSTPSEQIEGHLPEKSIQDVFDNPGKPGPKCEGDPIVDLVFQLRIGIDPVPLLQEKPFQEHQGRIGVGALAAGPDGIMRHQNLIHLQPVDDLVDLFQSLEAAVMFYGAYQRCFGEGHIRLDLFVSHIPSRGKFDGGNMAQIRLYVK
jgi:hypothetical protein